MILVDVTRISAEREPTYITTLPALRVSLDLSLRPGIQHIDTEHIDIQHFHTMQDIDHILHRVANQSEGHVTDFNTKSASDASMWQIRMQEVVDADADARARSSESFSGRILRDLDWAGVPYMRLLWWGGQAMTAVDHATATYRQHLFDDRTKEMERRYTELSQGLGLGVGVAKGVGDGALVLAEKTMGSEGRDLP
ncbi:unnamed protein product [Zymoseptoria tritici ST99CH_3D1]|nr:unnamed protein product [Zymoseptoria tritici ST99CH_3D1]